MTGKGEPWHTKEEGEEKKYSRGKHDVTCLATWMFWG